MKQNYNGMIYYLFYLIKLLLSLIGEVNEKTLSAEYLRNTILKDFPNL